MLKLIDETPRMRIVGAPPSSVPGSSVTPGDLAIIRSRQVVRRNVLDALADVAESRDGVAKLDLALLAGRRGDDFLELRDRDLQAKSAVVVWPAVTVTVCFCDWKPTRST